MQNDIDPQNQPLPPGYSKGKVIAGIILLFVGGLLLLQQLGNFFLPSWVISWGSFFLLLGLYSGAKHNFRNPFSYIMIMWGSLLLLGNIFPGVDFERMFWPLLIITLGMLMILKRNSKWSRDRFNNRRNRKKQWENTDWSQQYNWDKKVDPDQPVTEPVVEDTNTASSSFNTNYAQTGSGRTYKGYPVEDYLEVTSIFGSATKTIFTKNFRGGEIVNVFGGAEIDFTQSDINGQVVIDVTQIFGGIKLLVPPHWHVTSDTVSLFAGFDDKRKQKTNLSGDKILMITGTSIFAGIEIRSY